MHARRLFLCATSVPLLGGCLLGGDHDRREDPGPDLVSISRDEIRVGQRLEFLGEHVDDVAAIRFEGEFRGDDGSIHRVDLKLQPEVVDDRLVIPYFGPYQVPFGDGDQIGDFTGTVTAIDGAGEASPPLDVELRVLPSIIVRELASADVPCEQPARRLLAGGRLHLDAEVIGMDADEIAARLGDGVEVSSPGLIDVDIPLLAGDRLFAVTALALRARGAGGETIESEYLIGVHRSVEYVDGGRADVAQIEEPVPVSGCFSGGDTQGRTLAYAEDQIDERERTVAYNWNVDWLEEHGEIADVQALAEVGLRAEIDGPDLGPGADTWTVGDERTPHPAFSQRGDTFWDISSFDVLAGEEGMILPGEYGVWYRQATRVAHPATIVEYDACGVAQEVAADATAFDYEWASDLAQGDECPPFPEPDLPPADCVTPPCL